MLSSGLDVAVALLNLEGIQFPVQDLYKIELVNISAQTKGPQED